MKKCKSCNKNWNSDYKYCPLCSNSLYSNAITDELREYIYAIEEVCNLNNNGSKCKKVACDDCPLHIKLASGDTICMTLNLIDRKIKFIKEEWE